MPAETLKTNPIVNLDAFPIVANAVGEGAPGILRSVNGHVAATAGVTSPSLYRMVRIPPDCKIKHVFLKSVAQGGSSAADVDVGFSDSLTDGTQPAFTGLASPVIQITGPADNKLFGSATSVVAAAKNVDITFANTFTTDHQNLPLWQVLVNLGCTQFSANPGGFFDIILKTTTTVTAGGDVALEVQYVGAN
jgi:hypothetical protein